MTQYLRDPQTWPMLLVGPIVRRVTPQEVSVFVGLREPSDLTLAVFRSDGTTFEVDGTTVPIGERLHLSVLTATVPPTQADLQPGEVYEYDLAFSAGGGGNLFSEGLLDGVAPLGYDVNARPSFVLPPGRQQLRFAHASCRKAHGAGRDLLPFLDTLIRDARDDALQRPQQLFLTGDQIYADDVAEGLLRMANEAVGPLLGWDPAEQLPDDQGAYTISHTDPDVLPEVRTDLLAGGGVKEVTYYAKNHLLFFGEWCAVYLMAWSDALWPLATSGPYTYDYPTTRWETDSVKEYAESLPYVRRLLANVATYMMFDDHEVTDDWYLNKDVSDQLRTTKLGRHLMRNALAAYAVFQDWGNQPADYQLGGHGATIRSAVTLLSPATTPSIVTTPAVLDAVLDIGPIPASAASPGGRKRWDWTLSCPEHFVLSLDTRTWRGFVSDQSTGIDAKLARRMSAALIDHLPAGASAQQLIIDHNLVGRGHDQLLVVISPAPLIGHATAELIQQGLKLKEILNPNETWDNEAWGYHGASYQAALTRLAPHSPVLALSGDVHYAFTVSSTFSHASGPPARFIQLCSSAAKNETPKADAASTLMALPPQVLEEIEHLDSDEQQTLLERLRQSTVVVGDTIDEFFDQHGDDIRRQLEAQLQDMAANTLDDWDGIDELERLVLRTLTKPIRENLFYAGPENVETIRLTLEALGLTGESYLHRAALEDDRAPATRDDHFPASQPQLDPTNDLDAGVLARQTAGPTVCNVALVWFTTDGPHEVVVHDIFWRPEKAYVSPDIYPMLTRHEAQLRQPAHSQDSTP